MFVCRGGQQWFNYTKGCWQWDLEKIEGMQYTDNVVEFMAQDLRKLPKEVLNPSHWPSVHSCH
jgi:predicted ATPase